MATIESKGGSIKSAENDEEIKFSFRRVSLRKLEKALGLLEDASGSGATRLQKISCRDEAFKLLVDNERVLEEGTWVDVQEVLQAAIKFNQVGDDDEKKSD